MANERTVNSIISNITSSRQKFQVFKEMSLRTFYKLEPPFVVGGNTDYFIFKFYQPANINISVQGEPVELFYGNVHSLQCEGKPAAMLVSTPKLDHKIYHDCLISGPKSIKNVDSLDDKSETVVLNNEFSVMVLDDKIQYIIGKNSVIQSYLN